MVQTTGLDGKNLLKLLPVSKPPGNLSSSMADNTEGSSLATKLTVNSPILPSGHGLQIPADAEVKSVLASSFPPAIQQRILAAAAASNASGTSEAVKQPTLIYVSPVKTVKTSVSIPLQNIYSKPVSQVSTSLVLTTPQMGGNGSAINMVKSDGQKPQGAPMKWVVQENPQSPVSCSQHLVPTYSSNKVASEIFKNWANMKNAKSDSSSILPASANSMSGSQTEITSIKDNGLVMYDGKIYLLVKRDAKVVSAQDDNQISSTAGIQSRKHTSQPIHSHADSTVTNQVVNLVLSKNKGIAKDPKSSENNIPHLQCELYKNLKDAPVLSTPPSESLQVTSTSQHEEVSTSGPVLTGMNVTQKIVAKENESHQILGKTPFLKPSSAFLQDSTMHGAFKEEEQKIEKINSSGMAIQIKHRKEQQRKLYLELRKKFGLFKEERVYLRRIPLPISLTRPKATVCSSSVQMSGPCQLPQAVPTKVYPKEKERIIEKHGKVEMAHLQESTKRRKIEVNCALNPNLKCSSSYLGMDNPRSPCRQVIPQQENPPSSPQYFPGGDYNTNPCVQSNEQDIWSPEHHFYENDTSFNEGSFGDDIFPFSPPDLEETKRDEKITRLKLLLKEQEAALEEIRKKMKQS